MKNRYEVVVFNGKTWENVNPYSCFSSRAKAEAHLQEWIAAQPTYMFKIIDHKKQTKRKRAIKSTDLIALILSHLRDVLAEVHPTQINLRPDPDPRHLGDHRPPQTRSYPQRPDSVFYRRRHRLIGRVDRLRERCGRHDGRHDQCNDFLHAFSFLFLVGQHSRRRSSHKVFYIHPHIKKGRLFRYPFATLLTLLTCRKFRHLYFNQKFVQQVRYLQVPQKILWGQQ